MADQCIVCLDALEVAVLAGDLATFKGLEDPGGRGGGDTLSSPVVADSAASSTTTTTTTTNSADEGNPGQSNNETDVAVINACGHALHNCCLLEWAGKANSCPICRQTFNDVSVYDKVGGTLFYCRARSSHCTAPPRNATTYPLQSGKSLDSRCLFA